MVSRKQRALRQPVVEPKGGGSAVVDKNPGDGSVGIELVRNNVPKIAVGTSGRRIKRDGVAEDPILPARVISREEFVDKLHQEAAVLQLQIFDPQAATVFSCLNIVPRH